MTALRIDRKDDGTALVFTVSGGNSVALDGSAVSALIKDLLTLRAQMPPPVVTGNPRHGDPVFEHPNGMWSAGERSDSKAGVVLMVSHPGLGWVRVHLSAGDAQTLARTIPLFLLTEAASPKQ